MEQTLLVGGQRVIGKDGVRFDQNTLFAFIKFSKNENNEFMKIKI